MKSKLGWPSWLGITLGLIVGITIMVIFPMYANYQAYGCIFVICS